MKIDVSTDFTLDTPHYWDGFWVRSGGLGIGGGDPDSLSKNLQLYHQTVWSRSISMPGDAGASSSVTERLWNRITPEQENAMKKARRSGITTATTR